MAITTLYKAHRTSLVRLLVRRGANRQQAEDITQDAFLKLLETSHAASIADHKAYLFRIAINLATDIARREQRHRLQADAEFALDELEDPHPSAETLIASRQRLELFDNALSQIPASTRTTIRLRMSGATFQQIAHREKISLKSAFARTTRAVAILKSLVVAHG